MNLNQRASALSKVVIERGDALRAVVHRIAGAAVVDMGVDAPGGLEAGLALAEICLAGLGRVSLVPGDPSIGCGPAVNVATDHPVAACLASQYAGWQIAQGKYFAMGSGPMRAAAGKETLFDDIGCREQPQVAVGVLETAKLPTAQVIESIAADCGVDRSQLSLFVARTASQAGTLQVVARSIETALHKLHELKFDVRRVDSGWGVAPLPPPAADDLVGIGRTNDSILYGARVMLWLRGDDESLQAVGPRVPSSASADHGQPFATIFERYGRDFYKIDPHLFSPAEVTFCNLDTGRSFRFGRTMPEVIERSFTT